jgi:AbrB family looped-hinge helix DNA binding protein
MKSMKNTNSPPGCSFGDLFYGSATVGERGQVVIPADARTAIGFQPGDKVLIMRHPTNEGLMLFKIEAVREFLDEFTHQLNRLEEKPDATENE